MSSSSRFLQASAVALAVLGAAPAAHAGFVSEVANGLGYIGFNISGQRMPLNGGVDLLVNRNFAGNPLDFGPWDITLQGPVSLSINTGGRALRELEVSLNTAIDENSALAPLNYAFNADAGGQSTAVAGNLLIDADFSINNFGYYELNLSYSSRQTVLNDGRFANDQQNRDFDIGPIVVSGNIVADVLAVLTEPLFSAAGRPNPFASFSATSKLNDASEIALAELRQQLADGLLDFDAVTDVNGTIRPIDINHLSPPPNGHAAGAAVPEPPVLLLMLAAVPFVVARKPWRGARGD